VVYRQNGPDEIRNGESYFEELRQRQVDQILQSFDPSYDKDQLRTQLWRAVALVPQQEPLGVETLGASTECKGTGVCTKLIVLEYKYPDCWILFRVIVSNQSGQNAITDLTPSLVAVGFKAVVGLHFDEIENHPFTMKEGV
jgi:hypothetical protein